MLSMVLLSAFNLLVLFVPPQLVSTLLTLMSLPMTARGTILLLVLLNVGMSLAFEQWGAQNVSSLIGVVSRWWHRGRRRSFREDKAYKVVEGGMR